MSEYRSVTEITDRARSASQRLGRAATESKNRALLAMAGLLEKHSGEIIRANAEDLEAARRKGIHGALRERLVFDDSKIAGRIRSLHKIAALPDPVGQVIEHQKLPNGLSAQRVRVPLGVLLMIYEARPHVTINAGAFALKSGNAIICKGGSEAAACNSLLDALWREALAAAGVAQDSVQVCVLTHEQVDELLQMRDAIDLVIPRGGKELIKSVSERSRIPVIKHFEGVCHVYIGPQADRDKAVQIVLDSKLLMPAVCNAGETVLVDSSMTDMLPLLLERVTGSGITVRGCPKVCRALPAAEPASEDDWRAEYLDRVYAVRVVDGFDAALEHIAAYGSGHTDVIVTENYTCAARFVREVDSSVVLVNASTMFCDGETLGMGAEIGISTDKFHARGPMGLNELTSYKHVLFGEGQIMGGPY